MYHRYSISDSGWDLAEKISQAAEERDDMCGEKDSRLRFTLGAAETVWDESGTVQESSVKAEAKSR